MGWAEEREECEEKSWEVKGGNERGVEGWGGQRRGRGRR